MDNFCKKAFHIEYDIVNLPFFKNTETGGLDTTIDAAEFFCWSFELDDDDRGSAVFGSLGSNGLVSIGYGGAISRRWIMCKSCAGLDLSITFRYLPGGRMISSSC